MNPLHSLVAHKGHFSLAKCVCELNSTAHSASHVHSAHPLPSPTVPPLLILEFTSMSHQRHTHTTGFNSPAMKSVEERKKNATASFFDRGRLRPFFALPLPYPRPFPQIKLLCHVKNGVPADTLAFILRCCFSHDFICGHCLTPLCLSSCTLLLARHCVGSQT